MSLYSNKEIARGSRALMYQTYRFYRYFDYDTRLVSRVLLAQKEHCGWGQKEQQRGSTPKL
jgi:hypothetical protein